MSCWTTWNAREWPPSISCGAVLRTTWYYSDSDNWTFEERGAGFTKILRVEGHECSWIKWHTHKSYRQGRGEWTERRKWLAAKLKKAPKPLAVFTANGTLAMEIVEVCEMERISIPQEVALIGIEDDLLLSQTTQRPITAVELNFEELGYQGAAWLDRMMRGGKFPDHPVRIPPSRIIARQSTEITAVSHEGLAKALRYIAGHFNTSIDIDAVARNAGMSRRALHQAFNETLGRTPGEHLRTTRLENAKTLLVETDHKVEAVALASGYPSVNSFFIAFKQHLRHASGRVPQTGASRKIKEGPFRRNVMYVRWCSARQRPRPGIP